MAGLNSFLQQSSGNKQQQNMKLLMQTRQSLLIAIMAVILSVVLAIFAILPQIQQVIADRQLVGEQQQELTKLQTKVNKLLELQDFVQSDRIQKVNLILPSGKPLLELLSATQYTASVSGVSMSEVLVTPGRLASASAEASDSAAIAAGNGEVVVAPTVALPATGDTGQSTKLANGSEALSVSMKITGTLGQINDFLAKVEKQTPFTNVTSFKLNPATIESPTPISEPLFEAEVEISTYSYTRPIAVAADAPVPDIGETEQVFLDKLDTFSYAKISLPTEILGGGLQDLFGTGQQPTTQP